jgi:hypothetical protein
LLDITSDAQTAFAEVRLDIGAQHLRAPITPAALRDLALTKGQAAFRQLPQERAGLMLRPVRPTWKREPPRMDTRNPPTIAV